MDLVAVLNELDKDEIGKTRVINPIYLENGTYFLSVQASYGHYCLPKKTVDLNEYTHFEVLTSLPHEDIPEIWFEKYDDGSGSLFWVVPKDEIETLLDYLNTKYGIYI